MKTTNPRLYIKTLFGRVGIVYDLILSPFDKKDMITKLFESTETIMFKSTETSTDLIEPECPKMKKRGSKFRELFEAGGALAVGFLNPFELIIELQTKFEMLFRRSHTAIDEFSKPVTTAHWSHARAVMHDC